jgi:tetratricopeptide (TPR) repeat protein
VDLAAGRTMVVCSFRFLLGETASERHAAKIREAEEALEEERYAQAYASALAASVYDEYSLRARLLADSSMARLLAAREGLLTRAVELEKERKYPEAIEFYRRLLIIYPDHPDAEERIERAEEQLGLYIEELIAEGDSLKQRREFDRARRRYELVQQLAPEDQRPQQRMAEIQAALRVNFRPILDRARDRLSKNQLDEAQRDFERVLAAEPQNREARVGLQMIRSRRTENIFERGKAAFDAADYLTALPIFLEVLEADDQHRRAREYLERTRAILRPQVELYYRAGLQYYMSDKYQAALDAWNTVLLIEPSHRDTLEYKKRAEEKMRALQRLETP